MRTPDRLFRPSRSIRAALMLLCLGAASCGKGDGKGKSADTPGAVTAECQSTREFFARKVWAPVMGQICIDCHGPGGIAPAAGASFQLMPPGYPGFLEENFKAAEKIAKTNYDGTPVLLLKPRGELDHGGGSVLEEGSDEYQALVEFAGKLQSVDSCPPGPAPTLSAAELLGPAATLRKATLELVGRLPTPAEMDAVVSGGEAALSPALDALMKEPAFIDRVKEIWNDVLLTDRNLSYNGRALNALDDKDFPAAATYYDTLADDLKAKVNLAVAREPLDLIGHIVEQEKPFTEILTANYTVVNDSSAIVYNLAPTPAAGEYPATASDTLREAQLISKHGGTDLAWPHAGVLTSPMFLERFPTTPTNRNRHRARKIFEIFLATDILRIAERPINPAESAKYINPTRDDPTCNQCHRQIDPVAGAFLRFGDYSQTSFQPEHDWHPEMFAPGFGGQSMLVSEFDRAPAWLADRIVKDPRFALAVVYTMARGLTGRTALDYPENSTTPDYEARLGAWEAQEATFGAISQDFAANGFNLKSVVRALVLSPYFRASGVAANAAEPDVARLADVGTARLTTPEVLSRKIQAVTGIPWTREWDRKNWLDTDYRILYGGIDSDIVVNRLTTPNGIMGAVQARLANEVACAATAWDFMQPTDHRYLFRDVTPSDTPTTNADAIRKNIQYLHAQILGEDLELSDPEIDRTYQLFTETLAEGTSKLASGEVKNNLPWACQGRKNWITGEDIPDADRLNEDKGYVIRSWMAVVTYLLSDYRFLYE